MNGSSKRVMLWLFLSALIILLDQLTKYLIVDYFYLYEQLTIIPSFFSLTLAYNSGAAFSFLSDQNGWQRWFLSIISFFVSIMLIRWLWTTPKNEKWLSCSIALILGGALGNLYDRILHGHVVDFLLFYYKQWFFPAFNLADSAITIGVVMLLIDSFFLKKNELR